MVYVINRMMKLLTILSWSECKWNVFW